MSKKDFSFKYNRITKTGKMKIDENYIDISLKKTTSDFSSFLSASSGIGGYGINLLRRKQ